MKWIEPNAGDTRKRSAFLLFPKVINHEVRWLVRAAWEERWEFSNAFFAFPGGRWIATMWTEEKHAPK
jgi:hypothetical protein